MKWIFWIPAIWVLMEVVASYAIVFKWSRKVYKRFGFKTYVDEFIFEYYAKDLEKLLDNIGESGELTPSTLLYAILAWPMAIPDLEQYAEEEFNRFCNDKLLELKDA